MTATAAIDLLRELEELARRQAVWRDQQRVRAWEQRAARSDSPLLRAAAGTLLEMLRGASDPAARRAATAEALRATARLRTQLQSEVASGGGAPLAGSDAGRYRGGPAPTAALDSRPSHAGPSKVSVARGPAQPLATGHTGNVDGEAVPVGSAGVPPAPSPGWEPASPVESCDGAGGWVPAPAGIAPPGRRDADVAERVTVARGLVPRRSGGDATTAEDEPPRYGRLAEPEPHAPRVPPSDGREPALPAGGASKPASAEAKPAKPHAKRAATRAAPDSSLAFETPVEAIPGIASRYAAILAKAGLKTARDLLFHLPRRYDDYSRLLPVEALRPGMDVTVRVRVARLDVVGHGAPARARRVTATFADATGEIAAVWFNQDWVAKDLHPGTELYVSGRVDVFNGRRQLNSPQYEPVAADHETLHTGRLVPVYPLTAGISNRWLRTKIKYVVDRLAPRVEDALPEALRRRWDLPPYPDALAQVHFPDDEASLEAAKRRIAFDEALIRQLALQQRKVTWKRGRAGVAMPLPDDVRRAFEVSLPFALTAAQRRAAEEILGDLASGEPMARLLQGDVGSGKTVVAALAAVAAAHHGYQTALMAPTEILAEQHLKTLTALLGAFPEIHVELLTGSTPAAQRRRILDRLATGQTQVAVGTHAIIQGGVSFASLGLAIIDEQHRFGVLQRGELQQKGYNPHLLVMSATPIPRTLERARYADLDVSIIDELPPGRTPVRTKVVLPDRREPAYAFVRAQVAEGRQAFVICPLVEDSEQVAAKAATTEYERLRREVFPDLRLALLHGRMRTADKDRVMRAFRDRGSDVLVSTTVIEVGIDVPNASIMMIEGAERFGLSQLHQLRGRVGRGAHESYCMLLPSEHLEEATRRLRIVEGTTDGFKLAEEDLKLRGPGEFYGVRQSGLDVFLDTVTIDQTHDAARDLLAVDPALRLPEHQALAKRVAAAHERLVDFD